MFSPAVYSAFKRCLPVHEKVSFSKSEFLSVTKVTIRVEPVVGLLSEALTSVLRYQLYPLAHVVASLRSAAYNQNLQYSAVLC